MVVNYPAPFAMDGFTAVAVVFVVAYLHHADVIRWASSLQDQISGLHAERPTGNQRAGSVIVRPRTVAESDPVTKRRTRLVGRGCYFSLGLANVWDTFRGRSGAWKSGNWSWIRLNG